MTAERTAALAAADAIPGIPRDDDGPVFREPWEAQAFAMTLAPYRRGLFTWPEWAQALSAEIKRAQAAGDPDTGETYYRHWLAALETLIARKGIADDHTQHRRRQPPGGEAPAAQRAGFLERYPAAAKFEIVRFAPTILHAGRRRFFHLIRRNRRRAVDLGQGADAGLADRG